MIMLLEKVKKIIKNLIKIIGILCIIICLLTQLYVIMAATVLSIGSYLGNYPFFLHLLLGPTLIVFMIFILKIFI